MKALGSKFTPQSAHHHHQRITLDRRETLPEVGKLYQLWRTWYSVVQADIPYLKCVVSEVFQISKCFRFRNKCKKFNG